MGYLRRRAIKQPVARSSIERWRRESHAMLSTAAAGVARLLLVWIGGPQGSSGAKVCCAQGEKGQLRSISATQYPEQLGDVAFDRRVGDVERAGDLLVCHRLSQQREDAPLLQRKFGDANRFVRIRRRPGRFDSIFGSTEVWLHAGTRSVIGHLDSPSSPPHGRRSSRLRADALSVASVMPPKKARALLWISGAVRAELRH